MECIFKTHYNLINQQMFIKDLLHIRHCSPIVTGLYLQILPVSWINTMHWKYSRWVCICVLFCLLIMFRFIHWLNYAFWRKKGSLPLSTKVNGLLPGLSHCGTEPQSSGPVHLPAGVGSRNSTLLLGCTLVTHHPSLTTTSE